MDRLSEFCSRLAMATTCEHFIVIIIEDDISYDRAPFALDKIDSIFSVQFF